MISLEQWRVVIGIFCPRAKKIGKRRHGLTFSPLQNVRFLFIACLLLLLGGDIESNPGPRNRAPNAKNTPSPAPVASSGKEKQAKLPFSSTSVERIDGSESLGAQRIRNISHASAGSPSQASPSHSSSPPTGRSHSNSTTNAVSYTNADIMGAINALSERFDRFDSRIVAMEEDIKNVTQQNDELIHENKCLQEKVTKLEDRLDAMENQSRRNNLIFHGLPSTSPQESWDDCENLVKQTVKEKLGIEDITIERAHRLRTSSSNVSPIIVKMSNYKDKSKILGERKRLSGSGIFITEDFSARVRSMRKNLGPHLRAARDEGKRATLVFDHLVIDGARYDYDEASGELRAAVPRNSAQ